MTETYTLVHHIDGAVKTTTDIDVAKEWLQNIQHGQRLRRRCAGSLGDVKGKIHWAVFCVRIDDGETEREALLCKRCNNLFARWSNDIRFCSAQCGAGGAGNRPLHNQEEGVRR